MVHRKTATTRRAGVVNRRLPGKESGNVGGISSGSLKTVTLIKELTVKGVNVTARRGHSCPCFFAGGQYKPGHIEGRVSGQENVIPVKIFKRAD